MNVANRLEQIGKEMGDWKDAVVVVSAECRQAAGDFEGLKPAGRRRLRGRSEPVEIFTYIPGSSRSSPIPTAEQQARGRR